MRILLAEDDYASRKFASHFLRQYGEVDSTVNGEEAVSAFEIAVEDKSCYDLICLDVMMPGTDGIEALNKIRELEGRLDLAEEKRPKIVMLSALRENEFEKESYATGCDGYTFKPLEAVRFEEILKKLALI